VVPSSQIAFEEAVKINGTVPAGQQADTAIHAAETHLAALRGRRSELGDGTAVAGDDHGLPTLDDPEQLCETIFCFSGADVHLCIIAINYGQNKGIHAAF